ncbi:putative Zinc metalloproteinase nas-14 [Hypsibius exemplaris]|uniref:Metalloendopeptidase n=1 Tax=Hypsibius exemplaris TaxID=2072580 RepID=A0A9X6NJJ4_HYPEX|nr:putative Zinc metalloproteinase nas-14 [Hypsibius exemplaris]
MCAILCADNLTGGKCGQYGKSSSTRICYCQGCAGTTPEPTVAEATTTSTTSISSIVPSNNLMNNRLFEGDIIGIDGAVIASSLTNKKKARNGLRDQRSRWVNGVIPYYIAEGFNLKQQGIILDAMDDFSSQTCIKFQPLINDPDSILFQATSSRDECGKSHVGREGGEQTVVLSVADDRDCVSKGIIQHELMHVVGFFHEQSRSDRNDFVDINEKNLDSADFQRNFLDWSAVEVTAFGFPYDFGSIMHYSTVAFSKDGFSWTIRPKKEWAQYETMMGQRNGLSQIDIGKINAMYKCPERGGAKPNQPLPPPPSLPTRAPIQPTKMSSSSSFNTTPNEEEDDNQTTTARPPVRPSVRSTRRTTRPSVPKTEPPPNDPEEVVDPETPAPTQRTTRPRRITPRPTVPFINNGGDISNVWPSYLQPGPRRTCEDAVISGQDCRTCTTSTGNGASTWKQQCLTREPDFEEPVAATSRPCEKTVNHQGLSCTRCYTVSGLRTNWNEQCLPSPATGVRQTDSSPLESNDRQCRELKRGTQTCTHCTWLENGRSRWKEDCRWKK